MIKPGCLPTWRRSCARTVRLVCLALSSSVVFCPRAFRKGDRGQLRMREQRCQLAYLAAHERLWATMRQVFSFSTALWLHVFSRLQVRCVPPPPFLGWFSFLETCPQRVVVQFMFLRAGGVPTRHPPKWDGLHTRHLLESTHTNTHKHKQTHSAARQSKVRAHAVEYLHDQYVWPLAACVTVIEAPPKPN